MVQEQQCGNQKTSTYKLSPVPCNATNRFWTNFCLHDVLKPSGVSQIPLHGWSASLKTIHFNIIPIIQILFKWWWLQSNKSNIHWLYYHKKNDGVYLLPLIINTILIFIINATTYMVYYSHSLSMTFTTHTCKL
jgi:hypothetical protein